MLDNDRNSMDETFPLQVLRQRLILHTHDLRNTLKWVPCILYNMLLINHESIIGNLL